ncbi:hypothetical protein [Pseudomonas sp. BGI-2]|uniref:hypothetical protein n=1 Tax=Pseudomonas sp. BGI-2 TaxID=2528211 RepID=UPI0010351434|nr:hypothetical protein [Pseudomonas sp. BGI-2]TBN36299.1 hypothetical protein EYC95_24505 [Pseudomonas sp. BGI-2]
MIFIKSSFAGFSLLAAFALSTQLSMDKVSSPADTALIKYDGDYNALEYTKDTVVSNSEKHELKTNQNEASGLVVADCDLPHDHCF